MQHILAVSLLAFSLFTVTFAVNLQAPLYSAYVAQSSGGTAAVTIAFSAYVAGLMPTLILLGGISDVMGRRIPLIIALILGMAATSFLIMVPKWEVLILARFILGIGTALATTSGTAYMIEIMGKDAAKSAALLVTSATSLGFGGGALFTSISLTLDGFSFFPTSYLALLLCVPVLVCCTLVLPRVDTPKRVSLFRRPVFPKGTWVFGLAMGLAWSTTGMTIAVVPLQLEVHGLASWTGTVIFLAIFIGFLCQPLVKRLTNSVALGIGLTFIPLGFAILLMGVWLQSIVWVLIGTGLTSASSYGFTYLSALSEFSIRAPNDRARAAAGLFIYAYVGFSIPVIASGLLADMIGLINAMIVYFSLQLTITVLAYSFWKRMK